MKEEPRFHSLQIEVVAKAWENQKSVWQTQNNNTKDRNPAKMLLLVSSPGERGERSFPTLAIIATLLCTSLGFKVMERKIGCAGNNLNIPCGTDVPEGGPVFWKRNGGPLPTNERILVNENKSVTIRSVSPLDEATYKCCFGDTELCVQLFVTDCENNDHQAPSKQYIDLQRPYTTASPSVKHPVGLFTVGVWAIPVILFILIGLVFHYQNRKPKKCESLMELSRYNPILVGLKPPQDDQKPPLKNIATRPNSQTLVSAEFLTV